MNKIFIMLLCLASTFALAQFNCSQTFSKKFNIGVKYEQLNASHRHFIERNITPSRPYFSLSMDTDYKMVLLARAIINSRIYKYNAPTENGKLQFFRGYHPRGEAHITVITPPEFIKVDKKTKRKIPVLAKHLSMKEINDIGREFGIQRSDIQILGIGSNSLQGNTTFYYIVRSQNLLRIRREIARVFYDRGGTKKEFDPDLFFPHITIGYLKSDIHYPHAIKDKRSCDPRFNIIYGS